MANNCGQNVELEPSQVFAGVRRARINASQEYDSSQPIGARSGVHQQLQLPLPNDPSGYHARATACRG